MSQGKSGDWLFATRKIAVLTGNDWPHEPAGGRFPGARARSFSPGPTGGDMSRLGIRRAVTKKKIPRASIRQGKDINPERVGTSAKIAGQGERTLSYVFDKYLQAIRREPKPSSFNTLPELVIPATLQELFPETSADSAERYFIFHALSIRRAFKECLAAEGILPAKPRGEVDASVVAVKDFQLLKLIILGCYPPPVIAEMHARVLASDGAMLKSLKGFSLTERQREALMSPITEIQQAMQGIILAADLWPLDFRNHFALDYLGWSLQTMTRLFQDRAIGKVKSIDVELGFTASGRGRSTQRKRTATQQEWEGKCFDVHILNLAGYTIISACDRCSRDNSSNKHGSLETLEKVYSEWRKHPITSVRLCIGDPLARVILSLPDARQIIETRFPSQA